MTTVVEKTRTQDLKARTHETHDALDQRIMANQPFATRENYARFLLAQYRFLRDADALYDNPELARLFPDLAERRRYDSIAADLRDLDRPLPELREAPISSTLDVASAMGWLYVVEGSSWARPFCTSWPANWAWTRIAAPATWLAIRMAAPATGARSPPRWTACCWMRRPSNASPPAPWPLSPA